MTPPALEIADLIRTAGAAFVERNRQWVLVCPSGAGNGRRSVSNNNRVFAQFGAEKESGVNPFFCLDL